MRFANEAGKCRAISIHRNQRQFIQPAVLPRKNLAVNREPRQTRACRAEILMKAETVWFQSQGLTYL